MRPLARPAPGRARRWAGLLAAASLFAACGSSGSEAATPADAAAAAPPEVTKEMYDDLETRVLELEVKVANLETQLPGSVDSPTSVGDESQPADQTPSTDAAAVDTVPADPNAWTYENTDRWGELSPDNAACSGGTEQSPIDLGTAQGEDIPNTLFNYAPVPGTVIVNDHTIEVQAPGAGKIVLDDQLYDFVQFHVHAPSEHTIEGERYPLELHFVHRNADGHIAVVAVLVTEGEPWPAFDDILVSIPIEQNKSASVVGDVDLMSLLPELTAAYRYEGSLTTPPCTEGVQWVVLQGTIHMSAEQIERITSSLPEPNARPQQPLNDRSVVIDLSAS